MLKKILGTLGARLINALISLSILIIITHYLGPEGVGTLGLLILGITIILLLSNFVGGGALIYLIPRIDLLSLLIPSYLWAGFSAIIGTFILSYFNAFPDKYTYDILFLSLIQSLGSINMSILLGKEEIQRYNIITVIQMITLFISLSYFIFILHKYQVISYVYSLYAAYLITFILSFFSIKSFLKFTNFSKIGQAIKQMFKYGSYVQFASIFQLMNYRLSYYIINAYIGRAALGIYTAGNRLSEGLWLIGKSVSMVQYTRISNSKDEEYSKKLTLNLLKFTFVITFILMIIVLLLPVDVFSFVFGKEFSQIKVVMLSLSVGIIAMSVSMMFSHFFSGTGRHYHNTIGSAIGVVITFILGFTLIPRYGIIGAGITASVSYLSSTIYQLIIFVKITKVKAKDFLIKKSDYYLFKREMKTMIIEFGIKKSMTST